MDSTEAGQGGRKMTEWNNLCTWFPTKGGLLECKNWVTIISCALEEETVKAATASGVGTPATSATIPPRNGDIFIRDMDIKDRHTRRWS